MNTIIKHIGNKKLIKLISMSIEKKQGLLLNLLKCMKKWPISPLLRIERVKIQYRHSLIVTQWINTPTKNCKLPGLKK